MHALKQVDIFNSWFGGFHVKFPVCRKPIYVASILHCHPSDTHQQAGRSRPDTLLFRQFILNFLKCEDFPSLLLKFESDSIMLVWGRLEWLGARSHLKVLNNTSYFPKKMIVKRVNQLVSTQVCSIIIGCQHAHWSIYIYTRTFFILSLLWHLICMDPHKDLMKWFWVGFLQQYFS